MHDASTEALAELAAFERFCGWLITDRGTPFELEEWQREVLLDYFNGAQESVILIGKGNGKTTLFGALSLFHLLTVPDADAYIAAASRDQASLMYRHAVGFIRRQPKLEERILIKAGTRELRQVGGTGRLKVLASDSNTADGIAPTLFLCDELHRHKTSDLYAIARDGLGKRNGSILTISTAGADLRSPLGKLRERAHLLENKQQDGFHLKAQSDDGKFVLHEWAVPEGEDTDDINIVKLANPSSFVTVADLKRRRESPSTHEREWLRYACNQWRTNLEDSWIETGKWALLAEPDMSIPEHAPVWLGVDIGLRHDTSAVTVISERADGKWMVEASVFEPPENGDLDLAMIENHISSLADYYSVQGVVYDRWAFSRSAAELSNRGLLMVEFPMTNERTVPACSRLLEAINRGELVHNGDPILQSHVESGCIRETERGWRISKGRSNQVGAGKIDALIALLLAFTTATNDNPTVSVEWI
jgi:phage terminase large subunit-like protein